MIKNTISFSVIVATLPLSFFSCAMEQGMCSSPQLKLRTSRTNSPRNMLTNSPRKGSLESPRASGLARSGSGSAVEIAVLAKTTLERVASKEKIAQLKKRNSLPPLLVPSPVASEASSADEEERLLHLSARSVLRSSKSPREKDEAVPVFDEEAFNDLDAVLKSIEIKRSKDLPALEPKEVAGLDGSTSGSESEEIMYCSGPYYAIEDFGE